MKKKILFVTAYLFFLCILDYPYIARLVNDHIQGRVVSSYNEKSDADIDKQRLLEDAREYNMSLADGIHSLEDAFDGEGGDSRYQSLLDVSTDGVMGTIKIPAIDLELPVYHGTSEEVLLKGAGHLQGSSLPIGGEGTHACISAHRGLPHQTMFTNLDLLTEGDLFYLYILDEKLTYQVCGTETVLPDCIEPLSIQKGKDLCTLITCTPYGINSHRLYVHGERIWPEEEEENAAVQNTQSITVWLIRNWWVPVTILLLFVMFIILSLMGEKSGKKK